jgi:hypothetical protein
MLVIDKTNGVHKMSNRDQADVNAINELLAQAKFMKRRGQEYMHHVERAANILTTSLGRSSTIGYDNYDAIAARISAAR